MKPLIFSLVYNRLEHTQFHVNKVLEHAGPRDSYYWMIVNNGSTGKTADWIHEHEKDFDKVVHLPFNHGPAHGTNRGFAERDKDQTLIYFDGDTNVVGTDDFIKCVMMVQERLLQLYGEKLGVIGGEWANFPDQQIRNWQEFDSHLNQPRPGDWKPWEKQAEGLESRFYYSENYLQYNYMWKKDLYEPLLFWNITFPPTVFKAIGYEDESTLGADLDVIYRTGAAGLQNFGCRAILFDYPPIPDPPEYGKLVKSGMLGRYVWMNKVSVSRVSEENSKAGNYWRSSVFDPESLKRYNPVIQGATDELPLPPLMPEDLKATYEEWSQLHIRYYKEHVNEFEK